MARTRNVDSARDALVGTFGASHFDVRGDRSLFSAHANFLQLSDIALCYCRYGEAVDLAFPESGYVVQQICLDGSGETLSDNRASGIDATNWSAVAAAGAVTRLRYSRSFAQIVVRLPVARLQRSVAALTGNPATPLQFDEPADLRSPNLQSLRRAISFLIAELDESGNQCSPVALAELQDVVVTRFLFSHLPELIARPPRSPSRAQMGVLEDYIVTHWNEPLTIETLAQVSNIGTRSIFRYFREAHGCTPLEFMKSLRLDQARRALQDPDEGTSVSAEALRCGFNNMGHFAKDYRVKFGELPSETLARARGRLRRRA